jgi:glutathionylspermidine synthase
LYWDERYAYCFNSEQIDVAGAGNTGFTSDVAASGGSCCAARHARSFAIPAQFWSRVEESWRKSFLYGRFDLSWDGSGAPKMLEYNAERPDWSNQCRAMVLVARCLS